VAKRNTRELILETSLALFNDLGEQNVTTNLIADEADISPGNLYYHFRSKNDITIELFKRFIVQLEPILDVSDDSNLDAEDLWFQLHLSFELKGKYRFLYRNLTDLSQKVPALDRALKGLFNRERRAASFQLAALEKRGSLKIDRGQRELLLNNLMLALIYWIPYAEILDEQGLEDGNIQVRAIAGVLQMVIPYLASAERREFEHLVKTYLAHLN